jgi:hypothetical protein
MGLERKLGHLGRYLRKARTAAAVTAVTIASIIPTTQARASTGAAGIFNVDPVKTVGYAAKAAAYGIAAYAVADYATWAVNQAMTPTDDNQREQCVAFTSSYPWYSLRSSKLGSCALTFFMYLPITLRQNLLGRHVEWHTHASKAVVYDKLDDVDENGRSVYQHVVFIGHGSDIHYVATDGAVMGCVIVERGIPKRDGEVIQHTCGGCGGMTIKDALQNDPSKGYILRSGVSRLDNYSRAMDELLRAIVGKMCENKQNSE